MMLKSIIPLQEDLKTVDLGLKVERKVWDSSDSLRNFSLCPSLDKQTDRKTHLT